MPKRDYIKLILCGLTLLVGFITAINPVYATEDHTPTQFKTGLEFDEWATSIEVNQGEVYRGSFQITNTTQKPIHFIT